MARSAAPPEKLQVVDLARSFAILSVLAYHMYGMPPAGPAFQWFWGPFARNGVYGVFVFFVVSGFLITRLIDGKKKELFRPRFREFYARRVARIVPLLLVHIGVGLVIVQLHHTAFGALFWASILTFSFNWFQAFFPNPVPGLHWGLLWSLSVEEQFYLFYPLLLKILGRMRHLAFLLPALIAFGIAWRSGVHRAASWEPLFTYKTTFGAVDSIAFGILLYLVSRKFRAYLKGNSAAVLLICGAGLAVLLGTFAWTDSNQPADDILSPALTALGTFAFLLGGLNLDFFESKFLQPFSWPGKFSYGIYLFHPLLYTFLLFPLMHGTGTVLSYSVFVILCTVVMSLSYRYFEMPANYWVRKALGFGPKTLS